MNTSTLSDPDAVIVPLTLQLRNLDAIRAVCRRRGWEFRADQMTYRSLHPGSRPAGLGTCDHVIAIPGCRCEVGLVRHGRHFVPVWDGDNEGLTEAIGPAGFVLWRDYVIETIRREAPAHGHTVTTHTDSHGTQRVRIVEPLSRHCAHVRMSADGDITLWTFAPGAWEVFRYLADSLGEVRTEGEIAHDSAPQ